MLSQLVLTTGKQEWFLLLFSNSRKLEKWIKVAQTKTKDCLLVGRANKDLSFLQTRKTYYAS